MRATTMSGRTWGRGAAGALAGLLIGGAAPLAAGDDAIRVLIAADEALGSARSLRAHVRVEHIGAVALDQPSLDVDLAARWEGQGWTFLLDGEATRPDAQTTEAFSLLTGPEETRVIDHEARQVVVASGGDAMGLLATEGVFPAVFWLVMWEGLITDQAIDGGGELPMAYAGLRMVDGVECEVVRVDYTRRQSEYGRLYDVWWFFDAATHLPVRAEVCLFRRDQNAYGFNIVTFSGIDTEAEIGDGDLALRVPEGYSEGAHTPDPGFDGPRIGTVPPDWTLRDAAGRTHRLSEYRGSVVVLDFWATWCGPCIAAMPALQEVHEAFANEPVHVLGLNVWDDGADPAGFMEEMELTYGLLMEADEIAEAYQVQGIPTIYAIGPDGRVIYRALGAGPELEAELRGAIERALATLEPAPGPESEAGGGSDRGDDPVESPVSDSATENQPPG